jgi:poly(beta-D-mannuronate) lyase
METTCPRFKKNKMKQLIFTLIFLLCSWSISAKRTIVSTAAEINGGSWIAGDTIVMKNGTWSNQTILFKAIGTVSQPVVLMAETPGSVILNGTSKLGFSGKYVIVSGLYFKNGTLSGSDVISFRYSSSDLAQNCRLTNCAIDSYNPSDNTVDSKWVSLYGTNNQVDHCSFVNKNNSGTLLVVWLVNGTTVNHVIADNYFGYRNSNLDSSGNELNGQEIIRVGDSGTSMTTASVTVEGNFFEHCNGEIETISNKSCGNFFSNNVFFECKGMLTLRHGNFATVEGNYFFGNGISSTGGVRIIGESHKVYNNYFDNLRGTDYRAAICIVRGKLNSLPSEYFQVKNATVEFNTFVNCTQAFKINYNSSSSLTLPPIGTVIAHNHIYNTSSSNTNVNIDLTNSNGMDVTWKNNLMNQGKYTNFPYNSSQVIVGQDAKMTLAGTTITMYEPGNGSALANYTTTENVDVVSDIRGRDRGTTAKLPGASQLSGTVTRTMPNRTTVGASFFSSQFTDIQSIPENTNFKSFVTNKKLIINTITSGWLSIYDTLGKNILQQNLTEKTSSCNLPNKGIYILSFFASNGDHVSRKIIVD